MIGLGISINTANRTLATQVSAIFRGNGYNGFMYDVNDISTLNQVSTGTTPVTAVTQPIGLMLDKHLGMQLGPELVTNGNFTVDAAGWTPSNSTLTAVGGKLVITATANGIAARATKTIPAVVGQTYKLVFKSRKPSGTTPAIGAFISGGAASTYSFGATEIEKTVIFVAPTNPITLILEISGTGIVIGDTCEFDDVSIKLINGNHPLQATAAARPTWQVDANGYHYAQFLGTDDSMSCASGGGGSTGFLFCAALKPTGGAGTLRTIYSDTGTNTGYKVQLDANNKLSFSAGDGVGYTTKVSTATVDVDTTYLLTCWDDGTNLNVQINSAAAETVARPVVVAGTAGYTLFKDNGAASSFAILDFYRADGIKNWAGTAAQLATIQSWVKAGAGL